MADGTGQAGRQEGPSALRALLQRAVRQLGLLERREVSCCGITLAQCHALQEVAASPGLSVGDLAERLGVEASTASRAAEALVRMGAVARTPAPGNRRAVALTPTPHGKSLLVSLEAQADAYAGRLWDALPPGRRAAVVQALGDLLEALARVGAGPCPPPPSAAASSPVQRGDGEGG